MCCGRNMALGCMLQMCNVASSFIVIQEAEYNSFGIADSGTS